MYGWDIVEESDHPIPMGRPQLKTSPNINTVGLVLRLIRELWSTGKSVIMYSVFCVLKGLLEISKRGVVEVH